MRSTSRKLFLGRCDEAGIEFIALPIPDGGVPATLREAKALAEAIIARLEEGKGVGLHCRAGIGRSAPMAMTPEESFDLIETARGVHVPDTEEQQRWVAMFHEVATSGRVPPA